MARSKWEDDFPERAFSFLQKGHIELELAKHLGISEATLNDYKNKYPEFLKAIKEGKRKTDDEVENALLKRALGYTYIEETREPVLIKKKIGGRHKKISLSEEMILTKTVTKNIAPDVTACIFWLKNRRPDQWRDRKQIDLDLDLEDGVLIIERPAREKNKRTGNKKKTRTAS